MKKIALLSLVASSVLLASGYKIPETSTNSVALGGANVAHVSSADAAYDNPANMVFMSDTNHMEADVMYIGTSATKFEGTVSVTGPHDLNAEEQSFIIPSLHYVSPVVGSNDARIGVSVVIPGGLTREWKEEPARTSAEEFTLRIIEVNPTVAFKVSEKVGIAFGFRAVHTDGIVKSNGTANVPGLGVGVVSRDMRGDSLDYGYNLALAYKPNADWDVGLTYRSKVNLTVEGNAKLNASYFGGQSYDGEASVTIPLPASLNAAVAYTFPTDTTVEFVYERTYWSAYENLDFDYDGTEGPVLGPIFGRSISKKWKDTNAFRLGVTQELDDVRLMAGLVFDESPVPSETLGFETPGSDALSVSLGARFAVNEKLDFGLAALYSMKEDRTITSADANTNKIVGTFSDSNILMVSVGVGYKF